jgi:hypothetical protein
MVEDSDSPKLPFDQCLSRERSPFSPSGEKVADRPDEGALLERSVLERPLTPALSPTFLQERCHMTPRSIRKKLAERGQHGVVQPGTTACAQINSSAGTCHA